MFGQLFGLFPLFVQRSVVCPHKFEKNRMFFLESAKNRLNFAVSKINRSFLFHTIVN